MGAAVRLTATVCIGTAGRLVAPVLGMDFLTSESFDESDHETPAATAAGMNIKPYDTHRIPYHQQDCDYLCKNPFHLNLQRYKIVPEFQINDTSKNPDKKERQSQMNICQVFVVSLEFIRLIENNYRLK